MPEEIFYEIPSVFAFGQFFAAEVLSVALRLPLVKKHSKKHNWQGFYWPKSKFYLLENA